MDMLLNTLSHFRLNEIEVYKMQKMGKKIF